LSGVFFAALPTGAPMLNANKSHYRCQIGPELQPLLGELEPRVLIERVDRLLRLFEAFLSQAEEPIRISLAHCTRIMRKGGDAVLQLRTHPASFSVALHRQCVWNDVPAPESTLCR
jgi:hypothetical protein